MGGQPLVPQMDGQIGQLAERGGKGLGLGSLRTEFAGEMQRIADDNSGHAEAPRQPRQRAQILAGIVLPLERQHRLGCETQCVGDGDADAPVADIESEITGNGRAFQSSTPALQLITSRTADLLPCLAPCILALLRRFRPEQDETGKWSANWLGICSRTR